MDSKKYKNSTEDLLTALNSSDKDIVIIEKEAPSDIGRAGVFLRLYDLMPGSTKISQNTVFKAYKLSVKKFKIKFKTKQSFFDYLATLGFNTERNFVFVDGKVKELVYAATEKEVKMAKYKKETTYKLLEQFINELSISPGDCRWAFANVRTVIWLWLINNKLKNRVESKHISHAFFKKHKLASSSTYHLYVSDDADKNMKEYLNGNASKEKTSKAQESKIPGAGPGGQSKD